VSAWTGRPINAAPNGVYPANEGDRVRLHPHAQILIHVRLRLADKRPLDRADAVPGPFLVVADRRAGTLGVRHGQRRSYAQGPGGVRFQRYPAIAVAPIIGRTLLRGGGYYLAAHPRGQLVLLAGGGGYNANGTVEPATIRSYAVDRATGQVSERSVALAGSSRPFLASLEIQWSAPTPLTRRPSRPGTSRPDRIQPVSKSLSAAATSAGPIPARRSPFRGRDRSTEGDRLTPGRQSLCESTGTAGGLPIESVRQARRHRIGRGSSPCSTPRRSPGRTSPARPSSRRPRPGRGAGSSTRRRDRRACRST